MSDTLNNATIFLEKINQKVGIYDESADSRRFDGDRGAIATLKRALTGEPKHTQASASILLPHLSEKLWHSEQWEFVACLYAYYPQSLKLKPKNFGLSVRNLNDATESKADIKGPERRFRTLLNMPLEDLHVPLASLVRLMNAQKKGKITIHYPKLIADLCNWDHPEQFVQDQWARSFWRVSSAPPEQKDNVEAASGSS